TISPLSVDLPMRAGDRAEFSCLTGFSLLSPSGTATTNAPTITCANRASGPQIEYSENRCISTNYCTLNSSTSGAGDVDLSNTDCHQPGILCQKTGSITNSILVSTGQNAIVNCGGGASGTKTRTCQSQNDGTWNGSCAISTCAVPATIGYSNLPANVNYATTSTAIAGSSCASGYNGKASVSYICNNTSGVSTEAIITASGCNINSCNIANVSGYSMHNTSVSCDAGYGIVDKKTVYAYCPTNLETGTLRTAQNGGGDIVSCERKFYEADKKEFDENTEAKFYSNGNYNMRYLNVEYGKWWDGCLFNQKGTCWKTYNKTNTNNIGTSGIGLWTLKVGNGICGDPVKYCSKKAKVWVGYCLREHCDD
ncbi:MAG: hypothetical protein EBT55_06465, partial [Proteobacteria bacterium]|nr:hypothetical protein [Pseudomonadota bacterium]